MAAATSDYMFISIICLRWIPWHLILAMLRSLLRFVIRPSRPWDLCLLYLLVLCRLMRLLLPLLSKMLDRLVSILASIGLLRLFGRLVRPVLMAPRRSNGILVAIYVSRLLLVIWHLLSDTRYLVLDMKCFRRYELYYGGLYCRRLVLYV